MRTITILTLLTAVAAAQDKPAFLGVMVQPVSPRLRKMYRVPENVSTGVMITALATPSPASRAGLRLADVIVKFDGQTPETFSGLAAMVRAHKPGDKVSYEVRRGTGTISGTLILRVARDDIRMVELPTDPTPPPAPEDSYRAPPHRAVFPRTVGLWTV